MVECQCNVEDHLRLAWKKISTRAPPLLTLLNRFQLKAFSFRFIFIDEYFINEQYLNEYVLAAYDCEVMMVNSDRWIAF